VLQADERDELVRLLESAHSARADWYARRKSGDWDDAPQAGFDLPDTSEQKLRGWLHLGRQRGDPPSPISRVDR
jgi:hypothetical protein